MIIEETVDSEEKSNITEQILRVLPDWFELEQGILDYKHNVQNMAFFVAKDEDKIIGFIALEDINEFTSEIHVMGVLPEYHRKGAGRQLINFAWNRNKKLNKKYLIVKTLDESAHDKFYKITRKFYKAMGFLPIMVSKDIWGKDNPCLIMIKTE